MPARAGGEEYERPDGAVFAAGDWLQIDTDTGVGRGRFTGVITGDETQFAFLRNFKTTIDPEPRRLQLNFVGGKCDLLDVATKVDGPLRRAAKPKLTMPRPGQFILFSRNDQSAIERSGYGDTGAPESWETGQVVWVGDGTKIGHHDAQVVVSQRSNYGAYVSTSVVHLSQIRARGETRLEMESIRAKHHEQLRDLLNEYKTTRHNLRLAILKLNKEVFPT